MNNQEIDRAWRGVHMVASLKIQGLTPRLALATERAEALHESAVRYEAETPETPETFARLNRMIGVADKQGDAADRLEHRIALLKKVCVLQEEEVIFSLRKHRIHRSF